MSYLAGMITKSSCRGAQVLAILIFCWFSVYSMPAQAQGQGQMNISYRVDKENPDVAAVLKTLAKYLTSRPDSLYDNPYWNSAEKAKYSPHGLYFDRSAKYLYGGTNAFVFLRNYMPTVLSVEPTSADADKFLIRTFFYGQDLPAEWASWNPPCILRLYATKEANSWKLENTIIEETKNWKRQTYGPINYVIHPNFDFDKKLAFEAVSFCDSLAAIFDFEEVPSFDYYLTNSEEELGRLFNFDFWLSYQTHIVQEGIREIATAKQGVVSRRDFAHMIVPRSKNFIVNEGIATYFGGTGAKSYRQALAEYSARIKESESMKFSQIANPRYYKRYPNNPLNVVGGYLAEQVFQKRGPEGLQRLISCGVSAEELFKTSEELLGLEAGELDSWIMNAIMEQ